MKLNKLYLSLIIILAILLITAGIIIFMQTQKNQNQFSDWQTYTSPKGFSFQYPLGYIVNETTNPENRYNTIVDIVKEGQPPPVLEINISTTTEGTRQVPPDLENNANEEINAVTFSLWEGIPWAGFPEIIETFRVSK